MRLRAAPEVCRAVFGPWMEGGPDTPSLPRAKTPGNVKRAEDYVWGAILGRGAFGDVVLATERAGGSSYAIKVLDKDQVRREKKIATVVAERDVLARCSHDNVVRLLSTFQDSKYLYYVMELCPNGTFAVLLKQHGALSVECSRFYVGELVLAVEHLHGLNIVHRDIKPDNMLLDARMHLKLGDFGTAKDLGGAELVRTESFVGTPEFISPELLELKQVSRKSDVWAVGCCLFEALCGRSAFRGPTSFLTLENVKAGVVQFPPETALDAAARALLERMLTVDVALRAGLPDVRSHGFFDGFQWNTGAVLPPPPVAAAAVVVVVGATSLPQTRTGRAPSLLATIRRTLSRGGSSGSL